MACTASAAVVLGLLLVLAQGCAGQEFQALRTVGGGGGLLPSSYANSYGPEGFNRLYPPYSYADASSGYGYYNNYAPAGYAREGTNAAELKQGCQSGLSYEHQTKVNNQTPSDSKAAQTISAQSSNVQQSIVQDALPLQTPMLISGGSYHRPYLMRSFDQPQMLPAQQIVTPDQFQHLRAADNVNSMAAYGDNTNNLRMVPSALHFIDMPQSSVRQAYPQQGRPGLELTYNPKDMEQAYGQNFQPPIFSLKKQGPTFRGLQFGYNYPQQVGTRYIGSGIQQLQPQSQHPLTVLRQNTHVDHTNQALPPNMYRAGHWEPMTNMNIEPPVNLEHYDNAGYPMQGYAGYSARDASKPLCREKRQIESSWMYPAAGWNAYDSSQSQQRAATIPTIPSPLTPYHGQYAPLSAIFPAGQQPFGQQQPYISSFTNPQAKGAVDGIQHFVSGIAQMMPMFTGGAPLFK